MPGFVQFGTTGGSFYPSNVSSYDHPFANVPAGSTDQNIVSAVAGKVIRVLSYILMAGNTETTVTFNSKPAGAGTAISMDHQCAPYGGVCASHNPAGYFETASGEGLTVTTGAGSTVGIQITYVVI